MKDLVERFRPYVNSAFDLEAYLSSDARRVDGVLDTTKEHHSQTLSAAWSELIRWAYETNHSNPTSLNDSLLPSDSSLLPEDDSRYWNMAVNQIPYVRVENVLREFGRGELPNLGSKVKLNWDGYITKTETGYVVDRS